MKRLNHFTHAQSRMKGLKALLFTMMLLAIFPFSKSFSNNLVVTNVTLNQTGGTGGTVTFDLKWDNSWRKSDWTAKNWDAAWVFVKWRACTLPYDGTIPFTHGLVSTIVSDHTFAGTTILEPTKGDGTVGIDAAPDNTGLMLRRAADGSTGPVTATVTMKIANLPSSSTAIDFRVYGIEMVFVPKGTYVLGDGDGSQCSTNSFSSSYAPAAPNINALAITSEVPQTIYESTNLICNTTGGCNMSFFFPKGYAAFYMMKYEISQGQFADFLNAINTDAQNTHYSVPPNGVNTNSKSMSIIFNITPPTPYVATRPDRACNYLSWINFSGYLEWAALRPLTELEYEKACRGPEQNVPFQKAWGITTGTVPTAGDIIGAENGTESITSGININTNNVAWSSGDANAITGPLRCGIFARSSTSTRIQTGMGFYGNMELSGNVAEYYLSALAGSNSVSNPSYNGVTPGDGVLNNTSGSFGYHNNSTWPTASSPGTFIIRRGGDWASATGAGTGSTIGTNISYRSSGTGPTGPPNLAWAYNKSDGDAVSGGRGGRSGASNSQVFVYTGAAQTFTVPAGVTSLNIAAFGAQGGNGGLGGTASGTVAVTSGQVFSVLVGQQPSGRTGGFNGGGNSWVSGSNYGGGGASDVGCGGTATTDRIIVAGGGGGYADGYTGGVGGGLTFVLNNSSNYCSGGTGGGGPNATGSNGSSSATGGPGGSGNTSNAGGGGGGGYTSGGGGGGGLGTSASTSGILGQGGNGAFHTTCSNGGGGGGGGYYGGGGGGTGSCGTSASGGGGSSAVLSANGVTWSNVSFSGTVGVQSGNGTVIFTW